MLKFKTFLLEDVNSKEYGQPVEHLPLFLGHDGVGISDFMLRDVHSKLLGKSGKTRTEISFGGIPVKFGVDSQTGEHFFVHGDKINKSFDDVKRNYGHDPKMLQKMLSISQHLPTITPRKGGIYSGKVLYTDPNEAPAYLPQDGSKLGVVVNADKTGKQLSNKDRKSFQFNPEVYNIDPTMNVDPLKYSMGQQINFLTHMDNARTAYSKMDPNAIDSETGVVDKHREHIKKYIDAIHQMDVEPDFKDYIDFLSQDQASKLERAKVVGSKDRASQTHATLVDNALQNKKYLDSIIKVSHHLNKARSVLSDVVANNENPGNVVITHKDMKAVLRLK